MPIQKLIELRSRHVFPGLLGCLALCAGCVTGTKTSDRDIQVIEIEQLEAMRENLGPWARKSPTVVVDVRSVDAFNTGYIPGALHIPVSELRAADPRLVDAHNIVVYGSGLTDYLSAAASKKLAAMGYANVYDFRSGIWMWKRQGHAVAAFAEAGDQ